MQDDKLDPAHFDFVLRLIANAQTSGIAELSYRGVHVRFTRVGDTQTAQVRATRQQSAWNTTLPVTKHE